MAVKAIRLQNFMGFADTGWIELRPITLLFGRNSSGKSAIIRALLLLRQSLETPDETGPLAFAPYDGADLGSFERIIHGLETDDRKPDEASNDSGKLRQMTFGFRCGVSLGTISDLLSENELYDESLRDSEWLIDLSLSFQKKQDSRNAELSAVLLEAFFSLHANDPERKTIFHAELIDGDWSFSTHSYYQFYASDNLDLPEEEQKWLPILRIESDSGFLPKLIPEDREDENSDFAYVATKFEKCRSAITKLLDRKSLRYLGPIRYEPRRVYLASDLSSHQWEAKGQSAIKDFLLRDLAGATRERLDFWFRKLELSESLYQERLVSISLAEESSEAVQINFYEGGQIRGINIKDVGQGAAQVLPVVLQMLFAPQDALIIVEQPELHLHPEAQATMADLFIESLNETREAGEPPTRFYLIETHSETLFLRLRVELARTAAGTAGNLFLKPEDFVCYYVERDHKKGVSKAEKITFDSKGEFVERPEKFFDFFGQDFKETMELRKARSLTKR